MLFPVTETIRDNIAEGNIGERGEEWALAQVVLLLCIALGGVPVVGNLLMFLTGPVFIALGSVLSAAGVIGLGKSLSPWPSPVDKNKLQTSGIFGIMRHPTYAGIDRPSPVEETSNAGTRPGFAFLRVRHTAHRRC